MVKSLEKFVTPATFKSAQEKALADSKAQESTVMYESMVPVPRSNTLVSISEEIMAHKVVEDTLQTHPNGRYADEAEDFYQLSPPQTTKKRFQRHCHTDTTSESISESLSEGEVKCKCNASIGELHLCKYARNIKGRVQYLKRRPDKLLRYEMAEPDLEVVGQKKHNLNWVSYYVKRPHVT